MVETETVDEDDKGTIVLVHDGGKAEIVPGNSADSIPPVVLEGLHCSVAGQDVVGSCEIVDGGNIGDMLDTFGNDTGGNIMEGCDVICTVDDI